MGPNFVDELDCGNFFDQIDDLIEFPPESECGGGHLIGSGDCEEFPSMWTDALPDSGPLFSGNHGNPEPDLSAELYVPYEDIVQLEWLSTFVEESFSGGGMTIGKENLCANEEQPSSLITQFQTSSPVSVLESSSSSYSGGSGKILPPLSPTHRGPHRARSKRPRPATFNPRTAIQLISPSSSSFIETPHPFLSDNFADSPTLAKKLPEPFRAKPRKKKIKESFLVKQVEMAPNDHAVGRPTQKCLHCEITKTPQWRSGPLGPKTLCNACGVRYKSGRLFPEYRPAASPTYVPSLHSHSHKKVVEMRIKGAIGDTNVAKPEFVPTDSK